MPRRKGGPGSNLNIKPNCNTIPETCIVYTLHNVDYKVHLIYPYLFSELSDLQKYGVTGEFFLLRQYIAKCRESHPQDKLTKEFVASIIAHKMAVVSTVTLLLYYFNYAFILLWEYVIIPRSLCLIVIYLYSLIT